MNAILVSLFDYVSYRTSKLVFFARAWWWYFVWRGKVGALRRFDPPLPTCTVLSKQLLCGEGRFVLSKNQYKVFKQFNLMKISVNRKTVKIQ